MAGGIDAAGERALSERGSGERAAASECGVCRRSVLVGERMIPFHDPRADRTLLVCELCRGRAGSRGWDPAGEPEQRTGGSGLRVRQIEPVRAGEPGDDGEAASAVDLEPGTPQAAIVARVDGARAGALTAPVGEADPTRTLLDRVRRQELELQRMRRELDPALRAQEQHVLHRQSVELGELRATLRERDLQVERLRLARHAETSPMRMSRYALDAFNQSAELERMARIARTLGDPAVNIHDEGPGIPRHVRLTLSWDIAWYEFTVKLDLGAGRASVHETSTGGDPVTLPSERRRGNARWRVSGIVLT